MKLILTTTCVLGAALLLTDCARMWSHGTQPPVIIGTPAQQYAQGIRLLVHEDGSLNRPAEAYPWLLSAAQSGLPNAQAMVGLCLQQGWGVQQDAQQAREWYEKAARQGQSGAAMQLAQSFRDSGDPASAAEWLETALSKSHGSPEAHIMLASLSFRLGAERKAVQHLRCAALDGSAEAAYLMALCYEVGSGVPKDEQLMNGWLRTAADRDYAPAKEMLQKMHKDVSRER